MGWGGRTRPLPLGGGFHSNANGGTVLSSCSCCRPVFSIATVRIMDGRMVVSVSVFVSGMNWNSRDSGKFWIILCGESEICLSENVLSQ